MAEDTPLDWYLNSKKKIPEIQVHLSEIRGSGINDIQKGLRKLEYVESVEGDLRYTSSFLSASSIDQYSGDEQINMLGSMLGGTITNLANETARVHNMCSTEWENGEFEQKYLDRLQASTDISSASTVILTHSIEERIRSIDTSYIAVSNDSPPESSYDHGEILSKLKERLSRFGEKYLVMLESSEESLLRGESGDLIQAAHSIRECFDHVLNILAPEKIVKKQPWFLTEYSKVRGVPKISQLKYVVRNSKKHFLEEDLENLDTEMINAKSVRETCVKIAHGQMSKVDPDIVRSSIDLLRYYLLVILDLYSPD